ncbi:MAG: hypothetical protein HYW48_10260 [Deltaproteobacteria bacterium]|nr:hypothetical protein [Deltaproteobacteria bacterium]
MKSLRLLMSMIAGFSAQVSLADMPVDAPGKLRNPEFWNRCSDGSEKIRVEDCIAKSRSSRDEGCISEEEFRYAESHGVGVFCIGKTIAAACPCSCFDTSTKLLSSTADGEFLWRPVDGFKKGDMIVTPSTYSSLGNLKLKENSVSYKTQGPESNSLYVIVTDIGSLKVTKDHAILLADGRMVAAQQLSLADHLVDQDGNAIAIHKIFRQLPSDGTVHNVLVHTAKKQEHLVIADGVLVGDLLWQNSLGAELNAVLLRQ